VAHIFGATGERAASDVAAISRGQPIQRFGRIAGNAAGTLDLVVYNFAARTAPNINLDQREAALRVASSAPVPTKSVGRRRGSLLRS
jgi:hypothetical protein